MAKDKKVLTPKEKVKAVTSQAELLAVVAEMTPKEHKQSLRDIMIKKAEVEGK